MKKQKENINENVRRSIYQNKNDSILKKIHSDYDENFQKLLETQGTPEHKEFIKIEKRLNRACEVRQKELGIFVQDSCRN